jgi:putative endonuclease
MYHGHYGGYVYILSNKNRSVLYIGVTSELRTRIFHHKFEKGSKFTHKYHCFCLLYYEAYDSIEAAISREKQLKKWKRSWKIDLIRKMNPGLYDLSLQIREMD